jgi:hypothetical protein
MTRLSSELRFFVFNRAGGCCEYCQLHQEDSIKSFHIDHIYAEKHGGNSKADNLCLSCLTCNLYKGTDMATLDPVNQEPVFLFHPRREAWQNHFYLDGGHLLGFTATGRATAQLLRFNSPERVFERLFLQNLGRYPRSKP